MTPCYRAGSELQCAAGEVARDGKIGLTGGTPLGVEREFACFVALIVCCIRKRQS